MNRVEIIGILLIVLILVIGISIKLYTRKKLEDIDGMSNPYIQDETSNENVVGRF